MKTKVVASVSVAKKSVKKKAPAVTKASLDDITKLIEKIITDGVNGVAFDADAKTTLHGAAVKTALKAVKTKSAKKTVPKKSAAVSKKKKTTKA